MGLQLDETPHLLPQLIDLMVVSAMGGKIRKRTKLSQHGLQLQFEVVSPARGIRENDAVEIAYRMCSKHSLVKDLSGIRRRPRSVAFVDGPISTERVARHELNTVIQDDSLLTK